MGGDSGWRNHLPVGDRTRHDRRQFYAHGLASLRRRQLSHGVDDVLFKRHLSHAQSHHVHPERARDRVVRYFANHPRRSRTQQNPHPGSGLESSVL